MITVTDTHNPESKKFLFDFNIVESGSKEIKSIKECSDIKFAEKFYEMHSARPFFKDLCTFISSGPLVAIVLEGKDAIAKNRELMGATNPAEAKEGTIRKLYAISIDKNSVHGSDSPESAKREIELFFNKD